MFYDCNKTHSIVNYFLKSCLGFTVYSESDDLCLQQFWKIIRISLNNVSLPFSLFFPSGTPIRWLLDLLKYMCSVMSNSTRPHGLQPSRLLHPWNFPGKNTGKGCAISSSKRSSQPTDWTCIKRCIRMSPALAVGFFIASATWEAPQSNLTSTKKAPNTEHQMKEEWGS